MHKLLEKLKEEFFAILPPTIFFFVALHILTIIRVLMAEGSHFEPLSTMSIAIASLILGKAVLIADLLPPINRYPKKPLAYNIAWKTMIYLLMASVIHYLERLFDFARQAGGIVAGNEKLLSEIVWPHYWAIEIILFLLILAYLDGPRTGASDRKRKGAAIILRAASTAGILSENYSFG